MKRDITTFTVSSGRVLQYWVTSSLVEVPPQPDDEYAWDASPGWVVRVPRVFSDATFPA